MANLFVLLFVCNEGSLPINYLCGASRQGWKESL